MTNTSAHTTHRRLLGIVVSDRMKDTCVVAVTRLKKHKKYQKYYKVTIRYKAHDVGNAHKIGEEVSIEETRPLSREKRWRVVEKE